MPAFSYERVKEFTGKVQFRIDGPSVATVSGKTVKRGEVIEQTKAPFAAALVSTGNFAHVPADTPLGVNGVRAAEAPAATPSGYPPDSPAARGAFTREEVENVIAETLARPSAAEAEEGE